jgi:hypothetical protein
MFTSDVSKIVQDGVAQPNVERTCEVDEVVERSSFIEKYVERRY